MLNFYNLYSLRTLFTPAQNAFISGGSFAESKWIWIRANLSLLTWLLGVKGQKGTDVKRWGNDFFLFLWHFSQGFKWWHVLIGRKLIPLDWLKRILTKFLIKSKREKITAQIRRYMVGFSNISWNKTCKQILSQNGFFLSFFYVWLSDNIHEWTSTPLLHCRDHHHYHHHHQSLMT